MAAQLLQRLAIVGAAVHRGMQAEAVAVGTQRLLEVRIPGHHALDRQHLLPSAGAEGDAVSTRGGLQRPERAGLVRITVVVGHVGRTLLFDQHPPTGEQLHHAGDDLVQHGLQRFALDQRDRAAVSLVRLAPSLTEQVARDHAVHHLQHGRHQLGLRGQQ